MYTLGLELGQLGQDVYIRLRVGPVGPERPVGPVGPDIRLRVGPVGPERPVGPVGPDGAYLHFEKLVCVFC